MYIDKYIQTYSLYSKSIPSSIIRYIFDYVPCNFKINKI